MIKQEAAPITVNFTKDTVQIPLKWNQTKLDEFAKISALHTPIAIFRRTNFPYEDKLDPITLNPGSRVYSDRLLEIYFHEALDSMVIEINNGMTWGKLQAKYGEETAHSIYVDKVNDLAKLGLREALKFQKRSEAREAQYQLFLRGSGIFGSALGIYNLGHTDAALTERLLMQQNPFLFETISSDVAFIALLVGLWTIRKTPYLNLDDWIKLISQSTTPVKDYQKGKNYLRTAGSSLATKT